MEKNKCWDSSIISDEIGSKAKSIIRDKEQRYTMMKRRIQQENITLVNIYALNTGAPIYTRQILMDTKRRD